MPAPQGCVQAQRGPRGLQGGEVPLLCMQKMFLPGAQLSCTTAHLRAAAAARCCAAHTAGCPPRRLQTAERQQCSQVDSDLHCSARACEEWRRRRDRRTGGQPWPHAAPRTLRRLAPGCRGAAPRHRPHLQPHALCQVVLRECNHVPAWVRAEARCRRGWHQQARASKTAACATNSRWKDSMGMRQSQKAGGRTLLGRCQRACGRGGHQAQPLSRVPHGTMGKDRGAAGNRATAAARPGRWASSRCDRPLVPFRQVGEAGGHQRRKLCTAGTAVRNDPGPGTVSPGVAATWRQRQWLQASDSSAGCVRELRPPPLPHLSA